MDWVDALTTYIADNGLGTLGVDLFAGDMQDDGLATPVIALNEYNGRNTDTMTAAPIAVDVPGLQVAVRAPSADDAKVRIKAIRALLLVVIGQTIHGLRFIAIRPNGTIHDLNRDGEGRQMYTANFEVSI